MDIAVDFDGTCVTHEYPKVGQDIGGIPVLKELVENANNLILYTMRSGKELREAMSWFKENGIKLYGMQKHPTQAKWTASNKCFAHLYIDDAALGCPLKFDTTVAIRPYVDWVEVTSLLIQQGLIGEEVG